MADYHIDDPEVINRIVKAISGEDKGIEQEAHDLVYGQRNQDYGPPTVDFTRTGKIWGAMLGIDPISPEMIALMMAALKISRLCQTPDHYDSRVDTIGYVLTLDRVIRNV